MKKTDAPRQASLHRATKETDIRVEWVLDGTGQGKIETSIRFFDHMLDQIGRHGGFDLSDHSYRNVGQYSTYADPGRARISLDPADEGKFKVPTLRNIALTAPYMHDGAMATLEEVVDHFASGGLSHPNKDPLMTPFTLSAQERADLLAFLNALTDERSLDQVP